MSLKLNEYNGEFIPYYVLSKIVEINYDAVVSTSEYNWVQQKKFNVISNEPINTDNLNYLIQKAKWDTRLKLVKETKPRGSYIYQYIRN